MSVTPTAPVCDPFALSAWRAALAATVDPHPFATPEFQRAWWSSFAHGRLVVLALGEAGRAGAAALAVDEDGVARFLGSEATTDYPGPAITPGRAGEAASSLLEALRVHPTRPRRLRARDLRDEDGVADALVRAARTAGLSCTVADDEPVARLDLGDDGPAWPERLPRHDRHELARKRRRLERECPGAHVRTATAATLDADLDAFCALHRRSPDPDKARFLSPALEAFVRDVAHAFVATSLRLNVLQDGRGRPLAATLGFAGPQTFSLYNMAFDPDRASLSPGIALVAALVARAIEDGCATFDFLRGLEPYKLALGARPEMLRRVEVELS